MSHSMHCEGESLWSVIANYEVIISLLEERLDEYRGNVEATSVTRGVLATMEKFHFIFGITVSEKVFRITDKLSKAVRKISQLWKLRSIHLLQYLD